MLRQWDVHIVREVRLKNRSQQEPSFSKSLRGPQTSSSCCSPGSDSSHGSAISILLVPSVPGYSSPWQDTMTLSTERLPSTLWPDKMCVSNNTELETARFPLKDPRAHSHAFLAWVSSGRQRTMMINPSIYSSPPPDTENVPQCLVQHTSQHGLGTWEYIRNANSQNQPPRPPASGILGEGPRNLCFNRPPRWLWCWPVFENYCSKLHFHTCKVCNGKPSRSWQKV